ncbi:O-methyltransferase [Streptomyces pluripotens]|uniref:O-methyltransferase n=1 Tax=Streptomyces pluripotens TaxID=1355015 RepID=A0A221P4J4_9ACTN|nr:MULTISPECIES: O-methyltransferase [Streptomyces]ASN27127.1 O-methyltransferase [Streptomyces pluripotens]KIE23575.1 SAM-dependent methyltransferase [Streptomyces sp. MUSC 125]MCH0559871.1 O-methyltransferase [Streptomyces sp. MUM 16J]
MAKRLRMLMRMGNLTRTGQVGDGREEALADYVLSHAAPGDVDDVIRVIDTYAYQQATLINVGDEKGLLLDAAVRRAKPRLLLELGTYCGYSALRMARVMPPEARLCSVELNAANASVAQRIWDHAGLGDQVRVLHGTLGDDGRTIERLVTEHGFGAGRLDFVFVDHIAQAYLPDLQRILDQRWLHPGSIVLADNMKVPGAPRYRAYLREREGTEWRTREHRTHVEYQSWVKDLVLESEYLPSGAAASGGTGPAPA